MEIHEIHNMIVGVKISVEKTNHIFGFIDNYNLSITNLHKHELENLENIIKHYRDISERRERNKQKKTEEKKE